MRKLSIIMITFLLASSSGYTNDISSELKKIRNKAVKITIDDYSDSKKTAIKDKKYLSDFTNHTEEHFLMVADKSAEIMETFGKAIKNRTFQKNNTFEKNAKDSTRINFGLGTIDEADLLLASIYHDSGMKYGGYILDKNGYVVLDEFGKPKKASDGNDIRKNHALNSAIILLADRDFWKDIDLDIDLDIDAAALLCFAHSKSTSGIRDLSSRSDWKIAFDKLDRTIKAYNSEHENKICFNREKFENDDILLSNLITNSLCLRLGDVSRDSGKHAKSQSGGEIVVYKSTVNSLAKDAPSEAQNARVYNYRTGFVNSLFSRQIHIGEQNNVLNHTFLDENNKVYHEMTINDGNYAPYCTFQNIIEHCGELESAPDADIYIRIIFNNDVTAHYKKVYNQMRQAYYDSKGSKAIKIIYEWEL